MKTLHINVAEKIATYQKRDGDIVCGNSDYQIEFTFDKEWEALHGKTARFIVNGKYIDVGFAGTTCNVPIISNVRMIEIGVYAGDLCTTTPAIIHCIPSILCGSSTPSPENDAINIDEAKEAAIEAKAAADRAEAVAATLEDVPKRGEFEAALGKYINDIDALLGGGA